MSGGYKSVGGSSENVLYDDSAFELFLVAFIAAIWLPWAIVRLVRFLVRLRAPPPTPLECARAQWCACRACRARADTLEKKNRPTAGIRVGHIVFLAGIVLLVVLGARVVSTNRKAEPPFDPFSILGVSETASKRDISKAYRRLAVLHHPDKNRGNPNAADKFIRISKAFAALTDETANENYRKYGNPDGYIGTTLGIGLPSWLQHNSTIMLCAYMLFLIAFPAFVGLWWRKQSEILPTSVSIPTFLLYRETFAHSQKFRDLLGCLAGSTEFAHLFKADNADAMPELTAALKRAGKEDLKRVKCVQDPPLYHVQNILILHAHLGRIEIPPHLQYIIDGILERVECHLTALTDTVGAFQRQDCEAAWHQFMHGHTTHLHTAILVSQCVIQGLDKDDSPLLQIPGFTDREVRYCSSSRNNPCRTVYEFMRHDMSTQRTLLRGFTDEQFLDVVAFCDRYPQALIEIQDPVVEGEEDSTVHANDTVTIRAKLTVMRRAGSVYSPHTPNLPSKKNEIWWVSLSDQRLMCPIEVRRLMPKDARGHDPEKKSVSSHDASDELAKDPRVTIYDLKFEFSAPREGSYTLELSAAVDCYVGCNRSKVIKMDVRAPVEADASQNARYFDTDDESEDAGDETSEEDSDEADDEIETSNPNRGDDCSDSDGSYDYIEMTISGTGEDPDDLDDLSDFDVPGVRGGSEISAVTADGNGSNREPAKRQLSPS
jgi:translocation protein SEC63